MGLKILSSLMHLTGVEMDSDDIVEVIIYLIILAVLVAAVVMAFKGAWLPAIFLAIVWNGLKSGGHS